MATIVHGFDWPDRVVVGTIGQPGSRAFYLQARAGRELISVLLEKEQSAALAENIDELLDALMAEDGNPSSVPESTPLELIDNDPLEQPVEPEFRVGALSLGWDPSTSQIVIEAYPLLDGDEDESDEIFIEPPELLVIRMPVGTARAFTTRTLEVVGAGRPLCPLCAQPMDDGGHVCASTSEA